MVYYPESLAHERMAGKIKLITDSVADLPPGVAESLDVTVVPLYVRLGNVTYRDGVDITPPEVYRKLKEEKAQVSSSGPAPGEYLNLFESLADEADSMLVLTLSSGLSTTYQVARLAAKLYAKRRVEVFDTGTATAAQALVVMKAARLIREGKSLDEILRQLNEFKNKVRFYATMSELEYVHRSGRVPGIVALLGSTLNINPVFEIRDGVVKIIGQTFSRDGAINYLCKKIAEVFGRSQPVKAIVARAIEDGDANKLKERLLKSVSCDQLMVTDITPLISAHAGPTLLGVGVCSKKDFDE